jgi:hypothetical protein
MTVSFVYQPSTDAPFRGNSGVLPQSVHSDFFSGSIRSRVIERRRSYPIGGEAFIHTSSAGRTYLNMSAVFPTLNGAGRRGRAKSPSRRLSSFGSIDLNSPTPLGFYLRRDKWSVP